MIRVALDAMGGDHAPEAIVAGAVQAVLEFQGELQVVLTGPAQRVEEELSKNPSHQGWIQVVDAPQLVEMDESPASVLKTKPESGLVKCVALQKAGMVQASVSAGNSGAMMAACLMILGRTGRISRPAIACLVPSAQGKSVMVDCGANVDEKPQHLLDFAHCGSIFAELVLGHENPRVGLLNLGEEEHKGTAVVQETYGLLKESPLNFIGNIEGRDIVKGSANVIVTSGFTGNVVLKLMEGFYELHHQTFGDIDTPAGRQFNEDWNYENTGGALLLGLQGSGFIAHGRSSATAIRSALRTAYLSVKSQVAERIAKEMAN
jgi:glycerol-3-phosphate acyltransferase PlsX